MGLADAELLGVQAVASSKVLSVPDVASAEPLRVQTVASAEFRSIQALASAEFLRVQAVASRGFFWVQAVARSRIPQDPGLGQCSCVGICIVMGFSSSVLAVTQAVASGEFLRVPVVATAELLKIQAVPAQLL